MSRITTMTMHASTSRMPRSTRGVRAGARRATRPKAIALSVVIPAYNEARRIVETLKSTLAFLTARGETFEIIVVDDGSHDDTPRTIQALGHPRVFVLCLPSNRGKGAALRAGVAASRGDRVLTMDADLSTPLSELARLEAALDRGAEVAVGSRATADADVRERQSLARWLLGRAGNLWIQALAVSGIEDTQCGFKLFRGDAARVVFARCREERFAIDVEALRIAQRGLGLTIAEVGVSWAHREGSKVRAQDYAHVLLAVARIALRQA